MPKSIKADKFTKENIVKSSRRKPTSRVIDGLPMKNNAIGNKVNQGYAQLSMKNCLPNDNIESPNDTNISIMAFEALGVVIETISRNEGEKTFMNNEAIKPVNQADSDNKMQNKNYGDQVFPERDDPIYELDEAVPDFVKSSKVASEIEQPDGRVIRDLFYEVADTNMNFSQLIKLKQFSEN